MKRSEMLDHIKEDIISNLDHRWLASGQRDRWAIYVANQLLDMVEGFGMLPPEIELKTFAKKDNAWEKE